MRSVPPLALFNLSHDFSRNVTLFLLELVGILLQTMDNEIYLKINNCICFIVHAITYQAVQYSSWKQFYSLFSENSCMDGQRN